MAWMPSPEDSHEALRSARARCEELEQHFVEASAAAAREVLERKGLIPHVCTRRKR